ncbi:hypothetical protein DFJ73DRAFT_667441, partial [Zopfochytrium polystomum]
MVLATVLHGLRDLARVTRDDVVLVHAASGGVGQAAIKYLQSLGATVIASASPRKHLFLRTEFGLDQVVNSRDPKSFYETVMKITAGRGVSVVLNSLAGESLMESVRCLAPQGRFVEIGKTDMLKGSNLGMNLLLNNISFFSCHLDLLPTPELIRLSKDAVGLLETGQLSAIKETTYPIASLENALQLMMTSSHVGKVCVAMNGKLDPSRGALPARAFSPDGVYLFTGAFG